MSEIEDDSLRFVEYDSEENEVGLVRHTHYAFSSSKRTTRIMDNFNKLQEFTDRFCKRFLMAYRSENFAQLIVIILFKGHDLVSVVSYTYSVPRYP